MWYCSSPFPPRMCLNAVLYPQLYLPDLTTSVSLAVRDSAALVDFAFLVGAIAG